MAQDIKEWVKIANQRFDELKFLDSEYITWENTTGGYRPHIQLQFQDDTTEEGGLFDIEQTSSTEVKLIDGTDLENTSTSGIAKIGNVYDEPDQLTKTISVSGYLYLQWEYTTSLQSATWEFLATLPTDEENLCKHITHKIIFSDGAITSIIKITGNGMIVGDTYGDCDT